ncbi:MAG: DUF3515 domain-containing protein [Rhodoglobus sp.]
MRNTVLAALLAPLLLLLVGCSPIVALEPAPDAINPACAKVIVNLPETVATLPSRETDAQGTAAWGSPTAVVLHCGVPVPAPTATLPCLTVEGVDWLSDDKNTNRSIFTTYGRDPAVEVVIDGTKASGLSALTDLSFAVSASPKKGACIAPEDTTH